MNENDLTTIARQIAEQLFDTEEAVDNALEKLALFIAFMPVARRNANLSIGFGQVAIRRMTAAVDKIAEVRQQLAGAHSELADAQSKLGLDAVAFGGFSDKPGRRHIMSAPTLRLVDQAA
ncbi:hypothetical protein [Sandaracinobacteroides saxicola]|uniref:Uncharacterized protein n=1 Tax=Sandaracinobacteroides saxicola TaxID=2759707 RepID=A0A7G5IK27_9SPHN|nr:hypothetical protein [Sandaracinobacteroides saxicola]QMW23719.1 hypothetical protein H3309_04315 [Sandaracinobacteroides saxicola]